MENRGTGGTHCAGSRDYTRYKGKKVCIYMERPSFISRHVTFVIRITFLFAMQVAEAAPGVVLHDAQIYDMMRTKQKPNPALP